MRYQLRIYSVLPGHAEDFEAADRAYYSSPERAAFDPDPVRHLDPERIETTFLQATLPH